MYVPPAFAEDRLDVLHDFMRRNDFATLITSGADGPIASHVPVVLLPGKGPFGTLQMHLAGQNPQARDLSEGAPALAIFHGPHGYISPAWYATPARVPTWNYIVVHAYGQPRTLNDDELREHLHALTRTHELHTQPGGWSTDRLPAEAFDKLRRAIVGFEIELTRIQGKWKLGQNRTRQDREGAIQGLRESGANELADLMSATLNEPA